MLLNINERSKFHSIPLVVGVITTLVSHTRELRHAQLIMCSVHAASKGQKQDLNPGRLAAQCMVKPLEVCCYLLGEYTDTYEHQIFRKGHCWNFPHHFAELLISCQQCNGCKIEIKDLLHGKPCLGNVNFWIILTLSKMLQSHLFLFSPWSLPSI